MYVGIEIEIYIGKHAVTNNVSLEGTLTELEMHCWKLCRFRK